MFNSTPSPRAGAKLRRANPSGAGEQVRAINFASAAPSKIRGRAEFGLYLRVSAAAIPSPTSRRRCGRYCLCWCPTPPRSRCRSNLRPPPTRPPSTGCALSSYQTLKLFRWLPSGSTSGESRSGRIGPISLEAKQTGERTTGNPRAAFDEAGAGNVARPRWCDTRTGKSEPTGNTNFGLNRRVSPRPYVSSEACSAGERPAGARVRSPVVWIAGWRETKTLKPFDDVSRWHRLSERSPWLPAGRCGDRPDQRRASVCWPSSLPRDDRFNHPPAGKAHDVADDGIQLDVGFLERLLQALDMPRLLAHALQGPQLLELLARDKAPANQAAGRQISDPRGRR